MWFRCVCAGVCDGLCACVGYPGRCGVSVCWSWLWRGCGCSCDAASGLLLSRCCPPSRIHPCDTYTTAPHTDFVRIRGGWCSPDACALRCSCAPSLSWRCHLPLRLCPWNTQPHWYSPPAILRLCSATALPATATGQRDRLKCVPPGLYRGHGLSSATRKLECGSGTTPQIASAPSGPHAYRWRLRRCACWLSPGWSPPPAAAFWTRATVEASGSLAAPRATASHAMPA